MTATKKDRNTEQSIILLILDGFGIAPKSNYNPINSQNMPTWTKILSEYPHTLLSASGLDVGLPENQMGNSEVGHLTIGSGRVIYQDLTNINLAIKHKSFFENPILINFFNPQATLPKPVLHIMGLLSPGGVHSHETHLFALLKLANQIKKTNPKHFSKLELHLFLDGRDTPPQSALESLNRLNQVIQSELNSPEWLSIRSVSGRFYAMDRDQRWERTDLVYKLLTQHETSYQFETAEQAILAAYARQETDEFVTPSLIIPNSNPNHSNAHAIRRTLQPGDHVLCFNFRTDRMRQLCERLIQHYINLTTFTHYSDKIPAQVVFPKPILKNLLGEYLSHHNLSQLRLAETEKYAHVTFFLNGGQETAFPLETRCLIPSPKVQVYNQQPEMSVLQITETLCQALLDPEKKYHVLFVNFANADMVGHTGDLPATRKSLQAIDQSLDKILKTVLSRNSVLLITADHGNAECLFDTNTQQPHTAHTNNPVPFVYISAGSKNNKSLLNSNQVTGTLADIAPTILTLLGLDIPKEMTGKNLIN